MTISEFLQTKMDEKGIKQAELARRSGIPASTISSIIIRNNDRVAIESLLKLCEVIGCDIEEYINSLRKEQPQHLPASLEKKYGALDEDGRILVGMVIEHEYQRSIRKKDHKAKTITISRSLLTASAGAGEYLSEGNYEPREFPDTQQARQADVVIPVSGRSMEPMFHDGDELYVRKQPSVEIGEIGIFIKNGEGFVKEAGEGRLISLNPEFDDIYTNGEPIVCFGKVLGKVEGGEN